MNECVYFECILAILFKNMVQYLKIYFIGKVLNFVLFVPQVAWFTMDLRTDHLEDRDHARIFFIIIIYYEVFMHFFECIKGKFSAKSRCILA